MSSKKLANHFVGECPNSLSHLKGAKNLHAVRIFISNHEEIRKHLNQQYIDTELEKFKALFDNLEAHPLNEEQRRAVVTDDDRNLIVASAGSGKSSVIIAKVAWILEKNLCKPSEILILAYGKDTQKELEERLSRVLAKDSEDTEEQITINTFHKLGLSIIAQAKNKKPDLATFAEDPQVFKKLIKTLLEELILNKEIDESILRWFESQFAQYKSMHDGEFNSLGEYYSHIRRFDLRTLQGEQVRSFEECEIANFMYLYGIEYIYEAQYEHDTATSKYRQYKPDFYLPEYKIYIEHFGLDSNGLPPKYFSDVEKKHYLDGIKYKRELHKNKNTVLIETFSHEKHAGKLTANLHQKLSEHGVTFKLLPIEQVLQQLNSLKKINPFVDLLCSYITLYKEKQMTEKAILSEASGIIEPERAHTFLEIFLPVYKRYSKVLSDSGKIDFQDMIQQATSLANQKIKPSFKYILVDEFQDISLGRYRLLQSLMKRSSGAQLFAVGDDWQSIYRFTGADNSIIRNFSQFFGEYSRVDLETTHRFNNVIADMSKEFVLQNDLQLHKNVFSNKTTGGNCIYIGYSNKNDMEILYQSLSMIDEDASDSLIPKSVLILGRYRLGRLNWLTRDTFTKLKRKFPKLQLSYKTIHRSKGLEADYVVVVGLRAGKFGFPSEIQDDPLLDLVLAESEPFLNAEERRLFYVAMTRARENLFLLTESSNSSPFIEELYQANKGHLELIGDVPLMQAGCPKCDTGRIVQRTNSHDGSEFYGCSNYPFCEYKPRLCQQCNVGIPLPSNGGQFICNHCSHQYDFCDNCSRGWKYSYTNSFTGKTFDGCSTYPHCK